MVYLYIVFDRLSRCSNMYISPPNARREQATPVRDIPSFFSLLFSRDLISPFACLSASVALRPSTSNALPRRRANSRSSRLVSLPSSSLLLSCSRLALGLISGDSRTLDNNADLLICVFTHLTLTLTTSLSAPSELNSAERTHNASTRSFALANWLPQCGRIITVPARPHVPSTLS
jgi:hypothetical protein